MSAEKQYPYGLDTVHEVRKTEAKKGSKQNVEQREIELAERDRLFNNSVAQEEWNIRATIHEYPHDHPVVQYAESLMSRLKDENSKITYSVTVYHGEENAFVLPNGAVFISDRLIQNSDHEEEPLFVLMHEKIHAEEEHSKKRFNRTSASMLQVIGRERMNEWGADMRAYDALGEKGINPSGGVNFFERLRKDTRDKSALSHGRESDRVINLLSLTYIRDLPGLGSPMTYIPTELRKALAEERANERYQLRPALLKQFNDLSLAKMRLEFVRKADFSQLLVTLPEQIQAYKTLINLNTQSAEILADKQQELLSIIYSRIYSHLTQILQAEQKDAVSFQQLVFVVEALKELVVGKGNSQESEELMLTHKRSYPVRIGVKDFTFRPENFLLEEQLYAEEDVEELFAMLDPRYFQELGIKIGQNPNIFASRINSIVLKRGIFSSEDGKIDGPAYAGFVKKFSLALSNLYLNEANGIFDVRDLERALFLQATSEFHDDQVSLKTLTEISEEKRESKPETPEKALQGILSDYYSWAIQNDHHLPQPSVGDTVFDNVSYWQREKEKYKDKQSVVKETKKFLAEKRKQISEILNDAMKNSPEEVLAIFTKFDHFSKQGYDKRYYQVREEFMREFFNAVFLNKKFNNFFPNKIDRTVWNVKASSTIDWSPAVKKGFDSLLKQKDFTFKEFAELYQFWKSFYPGVRAEAMKHANDGMEFSEDVYEYGLLKGFNHLLSKFLKTKPSKEDFADMFLTLNKDFPLVMRENDLPEQIGLLADVLENYEFDLDDTQDLQILHFISTYLDNTSLGSRLQKVVWKKMTGKYEFSEGLEILRKEIIDRHLYSVEAFTSFTEEGASSHEELEEVKKAILSLVSGLNVENGLGKLAIAQDAVDVIFPRKLKKDLLLAMLGNGEDDAEIKRFLYEGWKKYNKLGREVDLDDIVKDLYRLDFQDKRMIVRELLIGEDGVFTQRNSKGREELFEYYLENFLKADTELEQQILEKIQVILRQMAKSTPYHVLYFALAPILEERILQRDKTVEWEEIVASDLSKDVKQLGGKDRVVKRILDGVSKKNQSNRDQNKSQLEIIEGRVEEMVVGAEGVKKEAQQTISSFILEVAGHLGAPGVRFSQIMGQYVSVNEELANMFRDVYDQVEGQPKFTAHNTLLREYPAAKDELAGLQERLGGGSLNSVFKSGEKAVKVRNPNALFHAETTYKLLKEVFSVLADQDSSFRPALQALEDIREWIEADVKSQDFLEKDKKFQEDHDGFSAGGRYKIKVPTSFGPESEFVMQDNFIDGINLTRPEELKEKGHDLKRIVSLVAKDFLNQIATGQVHSDVHPGNIRVTQSDEVAWLDRSFYLDLDFSDQLFLFQLGSQAGNPESAANSACDYLLRQGEEVSEQKRQTILEESQNLNSIADPTKRMLELSVILRKNELRLPLKLSLIIKNIFYLDSMSKSAGFKSFTEAVEYPES